MKTQIKKTVCVIMAMLMLVALVPLNDLGITAQAAKSGNFEYSVSGGKATVTGLVNENVASVIIPDTLGGYPVTNIGYSAFSGCKIKSVSLSEKVTSIGTSAFDCDTLIKITVSPDNKVYSSEDGVLFNKDKTTLIQYPASKPETEYTVPDSVTSFDSPSFDGCKYLETVNLPRNLWLMNNKFSNAVSLTDINVDPNNKNLSSIDGILFSKDGDDLITYPMGRQDREYTIPDEVTRIGNYAFRGDGKLQKINIGKGLTKIGYSFFARCYSLKEINIPDNVTEIGYAAFELCKNLTTVTIPNTVTIIDDSAFRNCYSLQKIEIPASVAYIGDEAFLFADLVEITILNPNCVIYDSYETLGYPETIIGYKGSTAEAYAKKYEIDFIALCTHDETYHISSDEVPATCTADGLTAGVYCSKCDRWISGHEVIWAHHTDEDGDKICDICKEDAPIIVAMGTCVNGESLESDLVWRLDENGKFTVTGSDAVVEYGMSDTDYRPWRDYIEQIKTVDIGDGVTSIGSNTFKDCINLTSVNISQSVTGINQSAFEGCTSLSDITIPQNMKSIDYYAFCNCTSLKSITIPKSVTFIGDYAFGYSYSSNTYTSIDGFTIYGPTDSAAETYAETNGFAFVEKICTHNKSTYISYGEMPATCKTGGYTAGKYCDECKEWITGHSFIKAHHTDTNGDDVCDVCGEATAITIKNGETKTIKVKRNEITYIAFTPRVSGTYSFTSNSDNDTYGYLFDSDKNKITEDDDGGDNRNFKITYRLEKGQKYYFGAKFYSSSSGSFDVTLTCDDYQCDHTNTSSVEEVTETCTESGFTAGVFCNDCETWASGHEAINPHHTDDNDDGICDACNTVITLTIKNGETKTVNVIKGEIVYIAFKPKVTGTYSFTSNSENYTYNDTYGYLFDSNKNRITGNDNGGDNGNFKITYRLEKGQKYYFGAKFSSSGDYGSFSVTLTCDNAECEHTNTNSFDEVPATCTESGFTAGVFCNDCETWVSGHEVINARHTDTDGDDVCDTCGEAAVITIKNNETKAINIQKGEIVYISFTPKASGAYSFILPSEDDTYVYLFDSDKNKITESDFELTYYLEKGQKYYFGASFCSSSVSGSCNATLTYDYIECEHTNTNSFDEVPATCTESGFTAGVFCNDCETWASGHRFIAAHHTDDNDDEICDICDTVIALTIKNGETKTVNVEEYETVYIAFRPKASGTYSFTSNSKYDTYGYLFDSSKNMITEDDDGGGNGNFKITYRLEKGQKYYFGASFCSTSDSGSFDVTLTCDDIECEHTNTSSVEEVAATCTENGFTAGVFCSDCESWISGHTIIAAHHTDDDDDEICDVCDTVLMLTIKRGETKTVDVEEGEITYIAFTPRVSGTYSFASNSDNDTYGYLFDSDKNKITEDDDGGDNRNFKITYRLEKGQKYYFGAKFYSSSSGSFDVTLTCDDYQCDHTNTSSVEEVTETCTENGFTAGVFCNDCETWTSGHETINSHHTDDNDDEICDICNAVIAIAIKKGETKTVNVEKGEIVYIAFKPKVTGTYSLTSNSENDTYGYLFDSNNNKITEDDDSGDDFNFKITYHLEKGKKYYFGAKFYSSSRSGSFDVTLGCDNFECDHTNTSSFDEVPATCTENGFTAGVFCNDCETWTSGHETINSHHTYGDWETTSEATCTNAGSKQRTCSACGDIETDSISALGHDHSKDWTIDKEATCTEAGSKSHHCSRCDDKADITEIEATGHDYGDWETTSEATCTNAGSKQRTCSACGDIETDSISALGHDHSKDWTIDKEATCTEAGSKSHHCSRCDDKADVTEIEATGHDYGDWETTNKATCTKTGKQERTCSVCKAVDTRTTKTLGHSYSSKWTVDKKATCTKTGSKSHHCTRCNAKKDVTTIEAAGHSYKTTTVKATTSKNGSKTTTCTVCGKVKSKSTIAKISSVTLSATSYTYNGKAKKPTVTVKDSKGNKLKSGTDYTVKYSSGRKDVGKYTVTVTFKGKYSGTKKLTFKINPKGTSISKLTTGKQKFTATLAKQTTQTSGYQLQYSTSSNMKNATTKTYSDASKTSKSVTGLKAGTKYYVRVRTYKNVKIDGKTVKLYSSWSSIGSVKTK